MLGFRVYSLIKGYWDLWAGRDSLQTPRRVAELRSGRARRPGGFGGVGRLWVRGLGFRM